eukprot:g18029.t1
MLPALLLPDPEALADHSSPGSPQACTAETLELHSYGMLLGCGEELFRGVEYVCCPSRFQGAGFEDVMVPVSMDEEDEGDRDNSQPKD